MNGRGNVLVSDIVNILVRMIVRIPVDLVSCHAQMIVIKGVLEAAMEIAREPACIAV